MFERVYTVTDYYDGPRNGVADLGGVPHLYKAAWDYGRDEYSNEFLLSPIDNATLALVLEEWAIWRRWEDAFHRGLVATDSHPALPNDRERYGELQQLLAGRLMSDPARSVCKVGVFRAANPSAPARGPGTELEVRWHDPA